VSLRITRSRDALLKALCAYSLASICGAESRATALAHLLESHWLTLRTPRPPAARRRSFFATEYKHTSAFWNRKSWRRKKRKKRTFGKSSADSRPILTIRNWRRRKTTSLSVWCRCKFTLLVVYWARRRRLPCCHWRQHIAFRAERLRVYTYRQQALLAGWGHSAPHADFE